jgi:hypothetical protein
MPGGSVVLTSTVDPSKIWIASLAMTPVAGSFYFGCSFSAAELMQ